jgi:hypothetical protein
VDSDLRGWLRFTAFKVFGLRLPALPHRITTDQKAEFQEPSYGQLV